MIIIIILLTLNSNLIINGYFAIAYFILLNYCAALINLMMKKETEFNKYNTIDNIAIDNIFSNDQIVFFAIKLKMTSKRLP